MRAARKSMLLAVLTLPPSSFACTFLCAFKNSHFVPTHLTLQISFRKKKKTILSYCYE